MIRRACDVPQTELEQAAVRAVLLGVMVIYTGLCGLWRNSLYWIWAVSLLLAFTHLAHIFLWPEYSKPRRMAGILMDQGSVIAVIAASPVTAAPLIFMSATISVGYGLRFGSKYSVFSALVAGVGFGAVALFKPAYRAEPYWMSAVIGCVALTPIYAAYLASRLERQRSAAETAAVELAFEAKHDALTGLANRRAFLAALAEALEQAKGRRVSLAVLFIDLDGFKTVNDIMGHAAGDAVLRRVAQCLRNSVRGIDLVARHGGDEFLVLGRNLPQPEDGAAMAVALEKKLHDAMAAGEGLAGKVTASIGVATYTGSAFPPLADSLIEQADAAMYAVKATRRRIVPT